MADAVLYPSGEDRVCAAVALGWQMAALYHSPVHRGPVEDPPRAARLPGYSGFPPATHARWLGEQIAATAGRLVTDPPQALTEALSAALAWLDAADREREATLNAIFTLHCRLLEALTGYSPTTSLPQGVAAFWAWYRNHYATRSPGAAATAD